MRERARAGNGGGCLLRDNAGCFVIRVLKEAANLHHPHPIVSEDGISTLELIDVRKLSPTPYGVFAIARDGQLVSNCYLTAKDLAQKIAA
ncbi:hypothetical protein FE840_008995 [Peteryoungia desertarenae]|uniref:Uncharacterized protein n=1 Tax=Peteryoungia desertarenae TaxID=1813451 RepID=A0ABX6QMG7_9HYPH|nr:hypothetical protein [Peteryoungia desertarenae]QLF69669.1 hypothetical protein FE840_008995 [Peteryoungia desertarenae]